MAPRPKKKFKSEKWLENFDLDAGADQDTSTSDISDSELVTSTKKRKTFLDSSDEEQETADRSDSELFTSTKKRNPFLNSSDEEEESIDRIVGKKSLTKDLDLDDIDEIHKRWDELANSSPKRSEVVPKKRLIIPENSPPTKFAKFGDVVKKGQRKIVKPVGNETFTDDIEFQLCHKTPDGKRYALGKQPPLTSSIKITSSTGTIKTFPMSPGPSTAVNKTNEQITISAVTPNQNSLPATENLGIEDQIKLLQTPISEADLRANNHNFVYRTTAAPNFASDISSDISSDKPSVKPSDKPSDKPFDTEMFDLPIEKPSGPVASEARDNRTTLKPASDINCAASNDKTETSEYDTAAQEQLNKSKNEDVAETNTKSKTRKTYKTCSVANCHNPQDEEYYTSPSDIKRRLKWAHICKRKDADLTKRKKFYICALHFSPEMFKRDLMNELFGKKVRKSLKDDAYPDINVPVQITTPLSSSIRIEPPTKKVNKIVPTKVTLDHDYVLPPTSAPAKPKKPIRCVIDSCRYVPGRSYHFFPSNPEIRAEWLKACDLKHDLKITTHRVCENHFTSDCYKHTFGNKKQLHEWAIPNKNLTAEENDSNEANENENEIVEPLLTPEIDLESIDIPEEVVSTSGREKRQNKRYRRYIVQNVIEQEAIRAKEECEVENSLLKDENATLKAQLEAFEKERKKLERESRAARVAYESERSKRRRQDLKIKRLQTVRQREVRKEVKQLLEKRRFTQANIKMIMNPDQKFVNYSDEDKALALMVNSISRKCYLQIRANKQLTLPHPSTLQRWLAAFDCSPGFQNDAIRIIKAVKDKTKLKNYGHAVLAFDEVDVKKNRVEMEMKSQTVYGPINKVQAVVMRGLFQS